MSGRKILVVEDEPIVALDLERTLQRLGYEVLSCVDTGEEALQRAGESRPDLVLMDINLAGEMDGVETAGLLRQKFQVPVIYLTAYSTEEVVQRATVTEPFGYLVKPFHANALQTSIEVALYKNEMERALRLAHDELEQRVQERTAELVKANHSLQDEITERQRIEAELTQAKEEAEIASRVKTEFMAAMSHELRTPLNAIIGYNEIMLEDARQCDEKGECIAYLEKVNASAQLLLTQVNDVLDLARIEADQLVIHHEPLSLPDFIHAVATTARPPIERHGNSLEVDLPDAVGLISTDPKRLRQCLLNLLSNAGKFTENGSVRLEVVPRPQAIFFRVCDTGIGIAPEHLGTLFDAFTQVDGSSTRKYGGSGLGLAITSRLCRLLGGDLSVESAPGKGSVFTICLPADAGNVDAAVS